MRVRHLVVLPVLPEPILARVEQLQHQSALLDSSRTALAAASSALQAATRSHLTLEDNMLSKFNVHSLSMELKSVS